MNTSITLRRTQKWLIIMKVDYDLKGVFVSFDFEGEKRESKRFEE